MENLGMGQMTFSIDTAHHKIEDIPIPTGG